MLPLAFAIGSVAATSGVPWWVAWAMAPTILSGSAQLVTLRMLADGAAVVVIVGAALAVTVRHGVFSAALAAQFPTRSRLERLAMAVPLVDQLVIACLARFEVGDLDEESRAAFYWGAAAITVAGWTAAHTLGMLLPAAAPDYLELELAAPLTYAGLLALALKGRHAQRAALASAVVAVAGVGLPLRSAVLVAMLGGVAAGSMAGRTEENDR